MLYKIGWNQKRVFFRFILCTNHFYCLNKLNMWMKFVEVVDGILVCFLYFLFSKGFLALFSIANLVGKWFWKKLKTSVNSTESICFCASFSVFFLNLLAWNFYKLKLEFKINDSIWHWNLESKFLFNSTKDIRGIFVQFYSILKQIYYYSFQVFKEYLITLYCNLLSIFFYLDTNFEW